MPITVPPVPIAATKWVTRPRGLMPDFGAGGFEMGERVGLVVVLIGLEVAFGVLLR